MFAAPRRLELRIVCTAGTPAREMLDVWPELPISIRWAAGFEDEGLDNVIAALEHNHRVCKILVNDLTDYAWGRIVAAMEHPFPALTDLHLWTFVDGETVPALPDSLLCGSATSLRSLSLQSVPFPALPNLLLTAPNLVCLRLVDIPSSGYISSAAMIDCLSSSTELEQLGISFRFSQPHPDQQVRRPPPPTRIVLSILSSFSFEGGSDYLADIIASVDTPLLEYPNITLLNPVTFRMSDVSSFIGCEYTKSIEGLDRVHILFNDGFLDIIRRDHR